MPASRSRTERWRECLSQIQQRGGGIELTVNRGDASEGGDLIWRVRLIKIRPDRLVVEHPGAMGMSLPVQEGLNLVGIMSVGQNRWMFHTEVLAVGEGAGPGRTIEIALPTGVERCMRRSFDRIRTAEVNLPPVRCWPLLDPSTARAAEVASRRRLLDLQDSDILGVIGAGATEPSLLPEVGPAFTAELANIGGGGAGLRIPPGEAPALEGRRLYWLAIDLRPTLPAPLCVTARLAHSHMDSAQNMHAGMAFDFQLHPEHKSFVLEQIRRAFELVQTRRAA